ncbi:MAG TPA: TlpA disulfide reductase family protein [Bryobacteraceae bacterium]|nr:TlpA disulfide reductase family protein [Bryobacteraceae bacterium]
MSYLRRIAGYGIAAIGVAGTLFAQLPVPRPAPQLSLTEPSGKSVSLAEYAGKVVLVQFLYTTCPHCQTTSRNFSSLQNELGSSGLQVLGIAFNEEAEGNSVAVRTYVQSNGVTFPVGVASRDAVLGYLGIPVMSRFVVPQIMVIDRKGLVRAQTAPLGSDELMDVARLRPMLEGLLKEAPRTSSSR